MQVKKGPFALEHSARQSPAVEAAIHVQKRPAVMRHPKISEYITEKISLFF
jgi:hypothetical protein